MRSPGTVRKAGGSLVQEEVMTGDCIYRLGSVSANKVATKPTGVNTMV